jgi:epoxyqueuosine reductase
MSSSRRLTETVKSLAREAGFARAGVAAAGPVHGESAFRQWLAAGRHGSMDYLARNVAKRFDPRRLFEGARSVLCLAVPYAPRVGAPGRLVARYARGRNYHRVLKQRCHALMDRLRELEPTFAGRAFVDSAPIAERSLAVSAGLGSIGRNGCLIVPGLGSYGVLAEVVSNLPLTPDEPAGRDESEAVCRDCGACAEACPTGAIGPGGVVDARRCISYLTVEHRGPIDPALRERMGVRLFGCDACQQACPLNEGIPPGDAELIDERPVAQVDARDVLGWSEGDWDAATRGSTTRRATYEMWLRNAAVAAGNAGDASAALELRRLADGGGLPAGAARWALDKLAL